MKKSNNKHISNSFRKENPWYPRHESDRVDELTDELDEAQVLQLYNALKTKTYVKWLIWLEDTRGAISEYDYLSRAQRKCRLQKKPDTETLLLHHACIFVELWRARINREYFCLPPSGPDLDTPESHRNMMSQVMAAFENADPRDLWPFDHPSIDDMFPFASDS